jgi:two-component system sensor histidine kinase DctS
MSGDELLAQAKIVSPETVRIVITAYSDLEPILRAVNEGLVVRYIVKPWDRAELDQILQWALEVYEAGRVSSAVQMRLVQTERLLTLGQVAAAVVHDVRAPLSAMHANADQLVVLAEVAPTLAKLAATARSDSSIDREQLGLLDTLASELAEIATELRDAVDFMNDVLTHLGRFQAREDAKQEAHDADALHLIRLACSMCRQEASAVGATIDNDLPETLPRVKATTVHFLQILINLLRNALQACGRASRGKHVVIQALARDADVRFTIRDEGAGMRPEVLAKIGTPFFTTRPDGTGLGVGQVRRLVGSTGGTFDVESNEGKGTTVTFTIPKA